MFDPDPPDSSRITSQRQIDRTWGNVDDYQPPNILGHPMPEHLLDKKYKPEIPHPSISPPDIIQTNNNNIPFTQFIHNMNRINYPEQHNENKHNQNQLSIPIPILSNRESMLSILSNQFYGKLSPHFVSNQKYNIIFSPYSLYYMLLCLLVGSVNSTFNELGNNMGMIKSDILPALIAESIKLHRELINHDGLKIQISNAFFISPNFKISTDYDSFIKKVGRIYPTNFNNPSQAISMMNEWVNDTTRGLIQEMISSADIELYTKMVMINVIYFKANWKNQFQKSNTKDSSFTKSNGIKIMKPLMYQKEDFYYMEDGQCQFITLPYYNPNFVMDFILPNKNNNDFPVKELNAFLEVYVNHQVKQNVSVYIPKFKQSNKISLNKPLINMGISKIFDPSQAELTNISNSNLYISNILQEAIIIVDEIGTEAVAATISVTNFTPKSNTFIFKADRTFQYVVRYVPTNTILFTGVYDG